jgi:dTDP-3-amino-3,4,6-trideoxy-alpha-D-glucose transaminase
MIWRCDLVPQYEAYREEIHAAIARVLPTGRYILASEVAAFEKEFAGYIGVNHGIGIANATDGLTLALMALGVGPGSPPSRPARPSWTPVRSLSSWTFVPTLF